MKPATSAKVIPSARGIYNLIGGLFAYTRITANTTIVNGALVRETRTVMVRNVETTQIILIIDPAHPKRFMRMEVKR
jgi:hypothetical protein